MRSKTHTKADVNITTNPYHHILIMGYLKKFWYELHVRVDGDGDNDNDMQKTDKKSEGVKFLQKMQNMDGRCAKMSREMTRRSRASSSFP